VAAMTAPTDANRGNQSHASEVLKYFFFQCANFSPCRRRGSDSVRYEGKGVAMPDHVEDHQEHDCAQDTVTHGFAGLIPPQRGSN
jgi:hypothetical protein